MSASTRSFFGAAVTTDPGDSTLKSYSPGARRIRFTWKLAGMVLQQRKSGAMVCETASPAAAPAATRINDETKSLFLFLPPDSMARAMASDAITAATTFNDKEVKFFVIIVL